MATRKLPARTSFQRLDHLVWKAEWKADEINSAVMHNAAFPAVVW
jgi:hypothetical protein